MSESPMTSGGWHFDGATEEIKAKWVTFNETVHLKDGVTLAQRMDMFAVPVHRFLRDHHPAVVATNETFWLTIFTAILESGTHSQPEVKSAIAVLSRKYAPHLRDGSGNGDIRKDVAIVAGMLESAAVALRAPLDTAVKRVGAVVMALGLLLLVVGLSKMETYYGGFFENWWDAMTEYSGYRSDPLVRWGTYLTIVGLALSYLYEPGLGRLVRWIRHG